MRRAIWEREVIGGGSCSASESVVQLGSSLDFATFSRWFDIIIIIMEELEVIRNSGQDGRGRRESSVALANLEDGAAAGPAAVIQPATVHHQQVEEIGGAAGLGLSPADKMDACHSIFHERAISEV